MEQENNNTIYIEYIIPSVAINLMKVSKFDIVKPSMLVIITCTVHNWPIIIVYSTF